VKARFVDQKDFHIQQVKVVTEAGTVYLMGLVTEGATPPPRSPAPPRGPEGRARVRIHQRRRSPALDDITAVHQVAHRRTP
jgi:hypothetical protein